MIFYTSDMHLGDERILRLSCRPFASVEEMDAALIRNWNQTVSEEDTVYILGDLAYNDEAAQKVRKLKGRKALLLGNHDAGLTLETLNCFERVDKIMTITDGGYSVCLCHYPLLSYENSIYGGYHLFGHLHNNEKDLAYAIMENFPRSLPCGVDVNGFTPKTLAQLIDAHRR